MLMILQNQKANLTNNRNPCSYCYQLMFGKFLNRNFQSMLFVILLNVLTLPGLIERGLNSVFGQISLLISLFYVSLLQGFGLNTTPIFHGFRQVLPTHPDY